MQMRIGRWHLCFLPPWTTCDDVASASRTSNISFVVPSLDGLRDKLSNTDAFTGLYVVLSGAVSRGCRPWNATNPLHI
ncbi:hypothetical protein GGS21DRAFT_528539 [Xylaria nigripes]|nr:hypothetical protein GGS21DRAFT_528539 [Xylaria nigripes]